MSAIAGEDILARLAGIERERGVRVLLAVEAGSRAGGFPSLDSDWDVRFVHAHPVGRYLSVEPFPDTIEPRIVEPGAGGLDLGGWDLRKALWLLCRSNATPLGWATSPIRYREAGGVAAKLAGLAERVVTRDADRVPGRGGAPASIAAMPTGPVRAGDRIIAERGEGFEGHAAGARDGPLVRRLEEARAAPLARPQLEPEHARSSVEARCRPPAGQRRVGHLVRDEPQDQPGRAAGLGGALEAATQEKVEAAGLGDSTPYGRRTQRQLEGPRHLAVGAAAHEDQPLRPDPEAGEAGAVGRAAPGDEPGAAAPDQDARRTRAARTRSRAAA